MNTPIQWKPSKGVAIKQDYINDMSKDVLTDVVNASIDSPCFVMTGDTLIIGFRSGENYIEMYRCKILETANFTQKLSWVQVER